MSAASDRLELVFHPAKQHQLKAALLAFFLGVIGQVLWHLLDPYFASLMLALLIASLRDFFLETRYEFTSEGISVYGSLKPRKTYPWTRFRTFVEDRNGLFFSPYKEKRSLDLKRGVFLPMPSESKKQAVEFCQKLKLERRAS